MAVTYQLVDDEQLEAARTEVLTHLRAPSRFPAFLIEVPESDLGDRHADIATKFLTWLNPSGFTLEVVNVGTSRRPMYEGRWTHNGADFVGFKQPPAAATREDAVILACAALLKNDWCRARLPK